MTVTQTASTPSSVTITVEGMADSSSRQTYVWITDTIGIGDWMTLTNAAQNGYITIQTDPYVNNGDIKIGIAKAYRDYKVWQFEVRELIDENEDYYNWVIISTILGFEYENANTKVSGEPIDITVEDLRQINLFGLYIDWWIGNVEGVYYPLDDVNSGDDVYWFYLADPAININNAAFKWSTELGWRYSVVASSASDIADRCTWSDVPFEALFFNEMKWAINNFMMSVSHE